jgi:hypothetical protein
MSMPGRRRHALAGALLATLVLGFHGVLASRAEHRAGPMTPGALFELILPGAFADDGPDAAPMLGVMPPPAGRNLATQALLHGSAGPTRASLYVGLAPLLLALVAACSARGAWATVARIALLSGLIMVAGFIPSGPIGAPLLVAAVAVLAGLGLAALSDPPARGLAPDIVLGAVCVLLAAVLGGFALQAGAVPDAEVVRPLLDRLSVDAAQDWSATTLAGNAAHLRAVLDRSALAAFACMTALLLHLKGRAGWSLTMFLLVIAADLVSARLA